MRVAPRTSTGYIIGVSLTQFIREAIDSGLIYAGSGATEAEVASAEAELTVRFPDSYRDLLLQYGRVVIRDIEVIGLGPYPRMPNLPVTTVVESTQLLRNSLRETWPDCLLSIVEDGFGGCYCLKIPVHRSPDAPIVWFDHELQNSTADELLKDCATIAPSLNDWIRTLVRTGDPTPFPERS